MKYAIITPTFKQHFKYIEKYLKSFDKYVIDQKEIQLVFTISASEKNDFLKITKNYSKLNITILCFEDILNHYNINYSSEELLYIYKKFTFQTLKKFYTMLYVDAEYFLVLDSESMWIRKTCMKELFESYFSAPFLTYSNPEDRDYFDIFSSAVRENTDYLLNKKCEKWFLENFVWFYDKKILLDMFNKVGNPIELAEKIKALNNPHRLEWGIFEIELYQVFVYQNNQKYNYKLLDAGQFLKEKLSEDNYLTYRRNFIQKFDGGCGVLERTMSLLTNSNYRTLAEFFYHNCYSVIRCEESDFSNFDLQRKFIKIAKPNILAASQGHAFGINKPFIVLTRKNPYLRNAWRHFKNWYYPLKTFLTWFIIEPAKIIFNLLKFLISEIRHIKYLFIAY